MLESEIKVTQLCPPLCNPMDYTVHGILQARILEWVSFPFSRGFSQTRGQTQDFRLADGFFTGTTSIYYVSAHRRCLWVEYMNLCIIGTKNLNYWSVNYLLSIFKYHHLLVKHAQTQTYTHTNRKPSIRFQLWRLLPV